MFGSGIHDAANAGLRIAMVQIKVFDCLFALSIFTRLFLPKSSAIQKSFRSG
jgi:hypothetical protein